MKSRTIKGSHFSDIIMTLVVMILASHAHSQGIDPWSDIDERSIQVQGERRIIPSAYRTVVVEVDQLDSWLATVPLLDVMTSTHVLALPTPEGDQERFRIAETPIMHADLGAIFPEIKTYSGRSMDRSGAMVRLDITPHGFHAMILSVDNDAIFIDPYSQGDRTTYLVYRRSSFSKALPPDHTYCSYEKVNDVEQAAIQTAQWIDEMDATRVGDCQLRTYRLALACTGEYANYHGSNTTNNNKSFAMAAMVTTMNRVNAMFERDATLTMVLVPNNDQLIFLNPSTDPYTNNNGSTMLGENQTTCNNIIGSANYDIGHVFSTGGGGVATLNSPCTSSKARGVTGQSNPVGDPFDIDYVAHEMGHQYGAYHTQNNSCNRSAHAAYEPGSASTIMGYAGICSPNVQSNSDALFHGHSMQEMAANITMGNSSTCPQTSILINAAPMVNAGPDRIIPRSTPFILTATASDPDPGNALTYAWEQMDNQVSTQPPLSTSTSGPSFRAFLPSTSPSRHMPALPAVINNTTPVWEVLSSVGRTFNFRVTVRDNYAGAGCNAQDNMVVTVSGTTGPFLVTQPNTSVSWQAGSTQTVTWDVAGTSGTPVNCANVDILLSVDGGFNWPHVLATATPNDGSQAVQLPVIPATTTARIMVRANANIFYDISNQNFAITTAPAGAVVNDNVCNAATLEIGTNGPFTNVGATIQTGEPSPPLGSCNSQFSWCAGGGAPSHTVWFKFVAPPSGRISLNFGTTANWDSRLALWSAPDCGALLTNGATLLAANDDITNASPYHAAITPICVTPGVTYHVQVDGYGSTTNGAFELVLVEEPAILSAGISSSAIEACAGSNVDITFTGTPGATVTYAVNGGSPQTGTLTGGSLVVNSGAINSTMTFELLSVSSGSCVRTFEGGPEALITIAVIGEEVFTTTSATPAFICPGATSQLEVNATFTSDPYCIPTMTTGCSYPDLITHVNIAGINRTSTCDNLSGSNGYSYFTTPAGALVAGTSGNTYSISTGGDLEGAALWIDYDRNGIFEAAENIFTGFAGTNPATYTDTFTVPAGALNGTTRMRVRAMYNTNPGVNGACTNAIWGETEDYNITITGGVDQFTYSWNNAGTLNNASIRNPIASPNVATVYTVSITTDAGCTTTANVSVEVDDLDSDGDGIPDCADNCPMFPGVTGGPCDPGPGFENGTITPLCTCAGTPLANFVEVSARVFLDGPYNASTGLMADNLRSLDLIPLTQPYGGAPWNHSGTESRTAAVTTVSGMDAIVDWILLELRDPVTPNVIVARRAALLLRNGDIRDTDGVAPVRFNDVTGGSYCLVVRHRNHLGVITASSYALSAVTTEIDLTSASHPVTNGLINPDQPPAPVLPGRKSITGLDPILALWGGNARNVDHVLAYFGAGSDRQEILDGVGSATPFNTISNVYSAADVNMDGKVEYFGTTSDRQFVLDNVGSSAPFNILELPPD